MANNTNNTQFPGRLEGQYSITLHSFEAVLALRGRRGTSEQPKICGLYEFSSRFSMIYSAAELDDPFAIYALVQVEDKIKATEREFKLIDKRLTKNRKIKSSEKMTYAIPRSVSPLEFKLTLANYGASVSRILVKYDNLILDLKNQIHLNMIPARDGKEQIFNLGATIRGLLDTGSRYNYTSCRKVDLEQRNQVGNAAIKKLVNTKFIDASKFDSEEDIFEYFITYPYTPKYGPATVVSDQVFSDRADRANEGDSKVKSRYSRFLPRKADTTEAAEEKIVTEDKTSKKDKSSKGPFKGRGKKPAPKDKTSGKADKEKK